MLVAEAQALLGMPLDFWKIETFARFVNEGAAAATAAAAEERDAAAAAAGEGDAETDRTSGIWTGRVKRLPGPRHLQNDNPSIGLPRRSDPRQLAAPYQLPTGRRAHPHTRRLLGRRARRPRPTGHGTA